jgi:HlyD family secretion protein
MKMRRWLAVGLVAVMAGAAIGWVALRPITVDAVRLAQAPLVRTVQFSARVATLARVDVGSTVTGRVTQVLVREGEAVARGTLLLRLEQDEARAALAQARANEAQAGANVQAARAELQRAQALVNQGFISGSRLDETRRAQDVAGAQQKAAQAATVAARARPRCARRTMPGYCSGRWSLARSCSPARPC